MKSILLSILFLLSADSAFCQTTKYQYASVTIEYATTMGIPKYKQTTLSFGTYYKISVEKGDEMKSRVASFQDGVDIINYMQDMGWEYINNATIPPYGSLAFYFKKPKE